MKAEKFFRTLPMKLSILLFALILFTFFSNDFGLVDIQKTAIILAVGIDKSDDGYTVASQIAVPKGSDRTTGGTSSVEIVTEGATVSDCITQIYARTGWVPKMVFCNLILIGEEAVHEDVFGFLNYFLRNEYMSDSCFLAACEGSACRVISSRSAVADASSLAITGLFSDAAKKAGRVMTITLKDLSIGYYGVSKSGYLPYVRMQLQEGSQSSGEEESGSSTAPQYVYSAEETAILSNGAMVGLLTDSETLAFSLLKGNVFAGTFNAPDEQKGRPVTLTVLSDDGKVELKMGARPEVTLHLDLRVRLCCRGVTAPLEDIAGDSVPDSVLANAEEKLDGDILSLWRKIAAADCDLFGLRRTLYRTSLKEYGRWKETLLTGAAVTRELHVSTTN